MTIKQVIIRIAIIIYLIELLIMIGLNALASSLPAEGEVFLDAFLLLIFSTPLIYAWVVKPFVVMRDKALNEVSYIASTDTLTDLPNREKFLDWLRYTTTVSSSKLHKVTVLVLDLNRFKVINDTFGHTAANEVVKKVAERLNEFLGSEHFLAKVAPDQFAILIEGTESDDELYLFAKKILQAVETPVKYDTHTFAIEGCIGISEYPKDASNNEELLRYANNAMRQAKNSVGENVSFYTLKLTEAVQRHFSMEEDLRNALMHNEFFLLYQPKINAKTQELVGVEALIRWNHPEKGLISPNEFIPLAEETGLIIPIGQWVLQEALSQQKIWENEGKRPIVMSINLSGRQLNTEQIGHILRVLGSSGLDMRYLEFEITETYLMKDIKLSQQLLEQLHNVGVSISLDDFGSGYSSLGYLKRFKIDTLKIDQLLIRDIENDANDFAIAEAIVGIGHVLNMKVIAEGVETETQMKMLQEVGCDYFQGYYFSKPVEPEEVFCGEKYRY